MDYKILLPREGYIVLKEITEKEDKTSVFKRSEEGESRAYGRVVSLPENYNGGVKPLEIGQLVCYNEFEGQELFKYGPVDEDNIIVIKEEDILLVIKESED